jgi:ferredoxin
MRVVVDRDLCQGHGMCELEAPEVFVLGDADQVAVRVESPDESQRAAVQNAVRYCPTTALAIEE